MPRLVAAAAALGAAMGAALLCLGEASAAEPLRIAACPSREKMEQTLQSGGRLSPDGCRTVTVTEVGSPAGPLCVLEFAQQSGGIVGAITDAVATTQWWVDCKDLHRP
ncbi:hypothetical protein E0493_15085 [Roseomonas sp. M0104]|uniref:Uncharacterized protein n=1 Tax=Teichococcus coralli TaxID=2545983 RepID=A0A845BCR1_9PROT|nr:hypothetical protein [Pseudoroseomonas coralli]MXP64675.1 hypothetical protein [Pseudoroseomonas coralli]